MCRLMAYMGPPVLVADVVLWPDRSIIKQSYDARERKMDSSLPSHLAYGNLNGDGFGIGCELRHASYWAFACSSSFPSALAMKSIDLRLQHMLTWRMADQVVYIRCHGWETCCKGGSHTMRLHFHHTSLVSMLS